MQRFSSVSFSRFEFEIAWAALAQASRLAGSSCMIRHYLPLACEVVLNLGVLRGFGRRLHRSLTICTGKKAALKLSASIELTRGGGGRRKAGGGGRTEEEGGRREKEGGGNIPDSTKRVLTFSAVRF